MSKVRVLFHSFSATFSGEEKELPSEVEMKNFEFDSNTSDEDNIFDKKNDNTFNGVTLINEEDISEQFPLFNEETEEEKREKLLKINSDLCVMENVKSCSIQDSEHLEKRFENSSHIDTPSNTLATSSGILVSSIVSNLNSHSSNINKKLSTLKTFSDDTQETNFVENSMENIHGNNSLKKESSDTERVVTENDFPIYSYSGTENRKKKKKKKDELKIKTKELITRLSIEQKMSEHLRSQVQKETNEQEKMIHKCEHLQNEITSLHKDYTEQQQQYAECLRTMKEVQDAYVEKTVAIENYKQEVIELQVQLQASEGIKMPPVAAAVNVGMSVQVESIKKVNEQLRRESRIQRHKLSECAKDIIAFCEKESKVDPLIVKIPASENPFRERGRGCLLI